MKMTKFLVQNIPCLFKFDNRCPVGQMTDFQLHTLLATLIKQLKQFAVFDFSQHLCFKLSYKNAIIPRISVKLLITTKGAGCSLREEISTHLRSIGALGLPLQDYLKWDFVYNWGLGNLKQVIVVFWELCS